MNLIKIPHRNILVGFLVGNLIELNRFVTFITTKNAVKLGFSIQIIFVIYSHSIGKESILSGWYHREYRLYFLYWQGKWQGIKSIII